MFINQHLENISGCTRKGAAVLTGRHTRMQRRLAALALLALFLLSCNSRPAKPDGPSPGRSVPVADSLLAATDSMVLVMYNDPFSEDSLRYSRYYRQMSTTRTADLLTLRRQLQQPAGKSERPPACRNEGKIWLFSRGKVWQTVYFAFSRSNCQRVYLIKDGFFYDFPPASDMIALLSHTRNLLQHSGDQGLGSGR